MLKTTGGDYGTGNPITLARSYWSRNIKSIVISRSLLSFWHIDPSNIAYVERISGRATLSTSRALLGALFGGVVAAAIWIQGSATAFSVRLKDGTQFIAEGSDQDFQDFYGLTLKAASSKPKPKSFVPTLMHITLSILTLGLWVPIWMLLSLRKQRS